MQQGEKLVIGRPTTPRPNQRRLAPRPQVPGVWLGGLVVTLLFLAALDPGTSLAVVVLLIWLILVLTLHVMAGVGNARRRLILAAASLVVPVVILLIAVLFPGAGSEDVGEQSSMSPFVSVWLLGLAFAGGYTAWTNRGVPEGMALGLALAVFSGFSALGTLSGLEAGQTVARSQQSSAVVRVSCEQGIRDRLVSPRTARFRSEIADRPWFNEDTRMWGWVVRVEAQNRFGVWLQSWWSCSVDDQTGWVTVVQAR